MFVTATFHGREKEKHAAVPATAILHLHDRDWVYIPARTMQFRRDGSRGRQHAAGRTCRRSFQELHPASKS